MAGLEPLVARIYHEKQMEGSMLCAQHALNSLLQGPYFSAPDLSSLAKSLDELEEGYDDDNHGASSTNMDDTGFFSVQVLENALEVWGLGLTRWRGEGMRKYHDKPHTQLAFILNYQEHWYTLRRFGPAVPQTDLDTGEGHWFNLNSFLPAPEWVSKLYLGMVLQQAESDGYSVFAITQLDPTKPLVLSRTEADELAMSLPEPRSAVRPDPESFSAFRQATSSAAPPVEDAPSAGGDFDEEDYELQAALQASLMDTPGAHEDTVPTPPVVPPLISRAPVPLPQSVPGPIPATRHDEHGEEDPDTHIANSMARNQALLQQMTNEQEFAQRELWASGGGRANPRALQQQEEDDEMLRRAIEESEAYARGEGPGGSNTEMDVDDPPLVPIPSPPPAQPFDAHRVYDDDDAELQAALKASLEAAPAGWVAPNFSSTSTPTTSVPPTASMSQPTPVMNTQDDDDDDIRTEASDSEVSAPPPAAPALTQEELRLKRLARFGS